MEIKSTTESNKRKIQITGQQMYIKLEKLSYACSIADINFKGETRSNLYKHGDEYAVFLCCRDFFMDPIQEAKIKEFGSILQEKPAKAELLIRDDALEKLSLLSALQ